MDRLYGVQYLRAFAALAVVVFHAAERTGGHFTIGAAGVDVFFVVSGFIMWVISQARPVTPLRFLRQRLERIAPLYWVATLIMVGGALAGLFPNLKPTLSHLLGSLFFIPHRSPSDGGVWPVLVQGWTLNYEMFFYCVFACCLLLPSRMRLPALGAVFVALTATGYLLDAGNALFLTYTDPIILEFLLGAGIGKLWLEDRVPSAVAGLVLVVIAIAGFALIGVTGVGFGPFAFGPLASALLIGVLALERGGALGHVRVATYLGDSSYSIYLFHTMAISVVAKFAPLLSLPPSAALMLAVFSGVAVGVCFYEVLERPLAAAFKRHNRQAHGNGVMAVERVG